MYVPTAFSETRPDVLHAFMRRHAFATLITAGPHGPVASHVPTVLVPARGASGAVQAHLARPNPQCEDLVDGRPVLVIFQGPHGYISPTWYAHPQAAVPTWNYAAVHAYGTPRVLAPAELREHLEALVAAFEPASAGAWATGRMTAGLLEKLERGIVGFEIGITRLEGKWTLSQNRPREDRLGAIDGLRTDADPESVSLAAWMAAALDNAPLP